MIIYQDMWNVFLRKIQYKESRTMRVMNFPETTINPALGLMPSHSQLIRHCKERVWALDYRS